MTLPPDSATPVPVPQHTLTWPRKQIGQQIRLYDSLSSTNDTAAAWGEPGGVVVATYQSAGRGQYGRVWQSEPGESLLMSVVVPPTVPPRPVQLIAWAAIAVGSAIYRLTAQQARIKWPNDLLIRGRKVCGILTESHRRTVVGIGLNLNQSAEQLEARQLLHASSLAVALGRPLDRLQALHVLVEELDAEFERLCHREIVAMEADWKWRIGLLGRTVQVEQMNGTTVTGRLREMSFETIELETDGRILSLIPEFVRHIRPA